MAAGVAPPRGKHQLVLLGGCICINPQARLLDTCWYHYWQGLHVVCCWALTRSDTNLARRSRPVYHHCVHLTQPASPRTTSIPIVSLGRILPTPYCIKGPHHGSDRATSVPVHLPIYVWASAKMRPLLHTARQDTIELCITPYPTSFQYQYPPSIP